MDGRTVHISQPLTHGGDLSVLAEDLSTQVGHEGHVRLLDGRDGGRDCGEVRHFDYGIARRLDVLAWCDDVRDHDDLVWFRAYQFLYGLAGRRLAGRRRPLTMGYPIYKKSFLFFFCGFCSFVFCFVGFCSFLFCFLVFWFSTPSPPSPPSPCSPPSSPSPGPRPSG